MSGRILEASWDVLLAHGFENFTFDRVARHAHIGKATIYSRFAGKRELMHALLMHRIQHRAGMNKTRGSDLPPEQAFGLRAAELVHHLFSPAGMLTDRLIDWLDQEHDDKPGLSTGSVRAAAYRSAIETIRELMIEADAAGAALCTDPGFAARLWLEGLLGHVRLSFTEATPSPAEVDRWADSYSRFFFAGIKALAN